MDVYVMINNTKLPTYSLIVLFGIATINFWAICIIKKKQLNLQQYAKIVIIGGIGAILGAKILTIIEHYIVYGENRSFCVMVKEAGFSYYGGLLGFLGAGWGYSILSKNNLQIYIDKLFPLLPLLHSIWKIGCLFGGCCKGIIYNGPFAVSYMCSDEPIISVSYFPVQVVEAIVSVIICFILLIIRKRRPKRNIIATYMMLYGATRFAAEYFRYYENVAVFSFSQIISILCVIWGFFLCKNEVENE